MKDSEWHRLQAQGDRIVASLTQDGFNCRQKLQQLSWYICKGSVSYTLTWLPSPICEWNLLPNDRTRQREQLLAKIHSILEYRGSGRKEEITPLTSQRFWHQQNYPWMVVRLLPNAQYYTIARFYSRTDAENHKRFLGKWMPAAQFEVIFDADAVS